MYHLSPYSLSGNEMRFIKQAFDMKWAVLTGLNVNEIPGQARNEKRSHLLSALID